MIRVGITGGIGSGKSYVCEVFSRLGVPVFYADEEARLLTDTDPIIRKKLTVVFGKNIFNEEGLNRPLLAEMIFHNKNLLEQSNKIIHPRVAVHFEQWCTKFSDKTYILHESAILFESDAWQSFDKIITVTAPEPIRTARVINRKNMTVERIRAIMKNQLPEEEKVKRSDYVIINDESALILPQIIQIHYSISSVC